MQSYSTFGGNSSSGFKSLGAKTSPLGAKNSQSFGGFGQTTNMPTFGQGNTNTVGGFGAKPAFGNSSGGALNSRGGMTGFMSKSSTTTSTFGATPAPTFGGTAPTFGGANTTSTFGAKPAFGAANNSTSGFGGFGQTQNQFQVSPSLLCLSPFLSFLAPATATPTTRRFWWRRLRPIWRSWRRCWSTKHRLWLASVPTIPCDRTLPREEYRACDPCHHCDAAIPKQKL
jgi:hypothetical protein